MYLRSNCNMEEWKEYKLGDVADITKLAGFEFTKYMKYICDGEIIAIRALNLRNGHLDLHDVQRISREVSDGLLRSKLHEGETILSYTGTIGACAIITENDKYHLAPNVCKVTPSKIVYPFFLYYIIRSEYFQNALLGYAHGSTQPTIPMKTIREIPIKICSFEKQIAIANILKSLDDKIELNRKINANLEAQAQALFKSCFVDFEPFKDQPFVESELGMIPEGLLLNYISEIPHVLETGRRPKGGVGEIAQGIPSVGAEHVKGIGTYDYSKTKYITPEYASSLKTGRVEGYELLIYKDGGKPGYFIPNYSIFGEGYPFDLCYLNEHVFKLDFNDRGYNAFCYFYFQTDYVMNYLNAQGGKAAIPGINKQDIKNIPIYSPNNEIVKHFGDVVLPLIKQILFNCKESRRLASLRDTLLPRLMSGELKVNEVI